MWAVPYFWCLNALDDKSAIVTAKAARLGFARNESPLFFYVSYKIYPCGYEAIVL